MIKLVALDLDNTVYDWVSYFVPSFDAMVRRIVAEGTVPEGALLAALQRVHQARGTTEYAFALSEVDLLEGLDAAATRRESHPAIEAFREEATRRLEPYPGVREVLADLKREGRVLVAYTDAMATYADSRLEQLALAPYFDELVATEDHPVPAAASPALSWLPPARFGRRSIERQTAIGRRERKPCAAPLQRLLAEHSLEPDEVVYVGDSLTRDVQMAQSAGVHDVYAAYGKQFSSELWERLVSVTHWTEDDVAREQQFALQRVAPTWTIDRFSDLPTILEHLDRDRSARETSPAPSRGTEPSAASYCRVQRS